MITCQVEKFSAMLREAKDIFPRHWEELALNKDKIGLSLDLKRYEQAEKDGMLHVVTVRSDGRLVGYFVAALVGHLHYKDAGLMAFTDIYYVLPEFRNGSGAKMLIFLEQSLRALGVTKMYLSCKVHQDHSELFKSLGYQPTDFIFTKYFGG